MTLARSKRRQRPDTALYDVVTAADLRLALDDHEPGALPHLMVVHQLTGLEPERDRTGAVVRAQNLRVDGAAGRLDLREVP